jgi:glycosyltransferase involved in cell wall biosynthesis
LYVNHTGRVSGGELSLLGLLSSLPAEVEPTVACPNGPLTSRLREQGVEVIPIRGTDGSLRLHPTRTPRALAEIGQAALQVRRAAASTRADLIHANSVRAGIIATAAGGEATIVHVRDCLPAGIPSTIALRAIGRADALIANSAYTRSTLEPSRTDVHVVHNAVDLARFDGAELTATAARARLGLAEGGPVLAVIAQITPWKGQDDAIRIAAELRRSHPQLQLLLVGSAKFDSAATRYDNVAYLESLQRQVSRSGLDDAVRFLGERDDVPELLPAVDLLLVPSWEEPFGRTVIEAMASGVPVAATDVGGPAEILASAGASCGLALPPKQPETWAEAIQALLADPARLSAMGEQGRRTARKRFGLEHHVAAVLEVYESVTGAATVPS